jgi:hypothetical protein
LAFRVRTSAARASEKSRIATATVASRRRRWEREVEFGRRVPRSTENSEKKTSSEGRGTGARRCEEEEKEEEEDEEEEDDEEEDEEEEWAAGRRRKRRRRRRRGGEKGSIV